MNDFSGRTSQKLNRTVDVGAFWPALELGELQEQYRIPSDYREETILHQTILAAVEVNRELSEERCQWVRNGWDSLAEVPAEEMGSGDGALHELVLLYKQAVFTLAKAKLMANYASMNRRDRQAEHPTREGEETYEMFVQQSQEAIRLIRGKRNSIDVVLL